MRILRTDGGGENFADERLQTVRRMLQYYDIKNIYLLHDHKGSLTIVWESEPTTRQLEILKSAWNFFDEYEIENKIVEYKTL